MSVQLYESKTKQLRQIARAFQQGEAAILTNQILKLDVHDLGTNGEPILARWLFNPEEKKLLVESPQGIRETAIASHGLVFYLRLLQRLYHPEIAEKLWQTWVGQGIGELAKDERERAFPDATLAEVPLNLKPEYVHVGAAHSQDKNIYAMNLLADYAQFLAAYYGAKKKVPFPVTALLLQINGRGGLPLAKNTVKGEVIFGATSQQKLDTVGAGSIHPSRVKGGYKLSEKQTQLSNTPNTLHSDQAK